MLALLVAMQLQAGPCSTPCSTPAYGDHTICVGMETETYQVWGPSPMTPGPLVVIFHSLYGDHDEPSDPVWDCYDFIEYVTGLGWYVVMADGGENINCSPGAYANYGSDKFQTHTEAVITDVMCRFPVDPNQVYGYGFSAGGADVLAYAARHRDPSSDEGYFAAVFCHSGYFSPPYIELNPSTNFANCMYEGVGYCTDPFLWQRATVLDLDATFIDGNCEYTFWPPTWMEVSYWTSQIHNVARLPIRTYHMLGEHSTTNMPPMNALLEDWLGNAYNQTVLTVADCNDLPDCPGTADEPDCKKNTCTGPGSGTHKHQWDAACASDVHAFFAAHTRDDQVGMLNYVGGLTLIPENDKRYHHFEVQRADTSDFARVEWVIQGQMVLIEAPNDPTFGTAPHNTTRLVAYAGDGFSPLDPTADPDYLGVYTEYATEMGVRGYANPPRFILRDWPGPGGGPPTQILLPGSGFTYDAASQTVLWNVPAAAHTWHIVPSP